jgi:hypothetical protein
LTASAFRPLLLSHSSYFITITMSWSDTLRFYTSFPCTAGCWDRSRAHYTYRMWRHRRMMLIEPNREGETLQYKRREEAPTRHLGYHERRCTPEHNNRQRQDDGAVSANVPTVARYVGNVGIHYCSLWRTQSAHIWEANPPNRKLWRKLCKRKKEHPTPNATQGGAGEAKLHTFSITATNGTFASSSCRFCRHGNWPLLSITNV